MALLEPMFACNAEYRFLACHTGFSVWIIFGGPAMNLESAFVATIRRELAALVLGTNVDTSSSSNSFLMKSLDAILFQCLYIWLSKLVSIHLSPCG